jgi:hypothetical protein
MNGTLIRRRAPRIPAPLWRAICGTLNSTINHFFLPQPLGEVEAYTPVKLETICLAAGLI